MEVIGEKRLKALVGEEVTLGLPPLNAQLGGFNYRLLDSKDRINFNGTLHEGRYPIDGTFSCFREGLYVAISEFIIPGWKLESLMVQPELVVAVEALWSGVTSSPSTYGLIGDELLSYIPEGSKTGRFRNYRVSQNLHLEPLSEATRVRLEVIDKIRTERFLQRVAG